MESAAVKINVLQAPYQALNTSGKRHYILWTGKAPWASLILCNLNLLPRISLRYPKGTQSLF